MIRVEVNNHEFSCDDIFNAIGDYLTNIASAVISVFKRIFCMEDRITAQDVKWDNQRCNRLQRENKELKDFVRSLKRRVRNLENPRKYSCINDFFVEVFLFLICPPLYIFSLPVSVLRSALKDT